MKAIVRAGVGTDNIDKHAATRLGIVVMNTPTGNTLSTAEHAFTLMLALSRNVAPAHQSLVAGRWERNAYMGSQLADKTLGIVGLGRIGQEVAKRALAFQMRVIGFDPFLSAEQAAKIGIERVEAVQDMLPRADYFTVHTPLTPETKHLIDRNAFQQMKKGVRILNCARGGIVDEKALLQAIRSGKVAGAALDVFEKERTLEKLQPKIKYLAKRLKMFYNLTSVGEIRQKGFMAGIELVKDRRTKESFPWEERIGVKVCQKVRERGVILRPLGNVIVLLPPLSMSMEELDELLNVTWWGINSVCP